MTISEREQVCIKTSDVYIMNGFPIGRYKPSKRCVPATRDRITGKFNSTFMRESDGFTAADMETAGRK